MSTTDDPTTASDPPVEQIEAGSITPDDMAADVVAVTRAAIPHIPMVTQIPRDGDDDAAQQTVAVARDLLRVIQPFADAAIAAADYESAADVRRRVSAVADLITRRGVSKTATLDAQAALRWAERALGGAIRAAQERGLMRSRTNQGRDLPTVRDVVGGSGPERLYRFAAVDADDWVAALELCRSRGSIGADHVQGALGSLTAEETARRDRLADLAGQGLSSEQIAERELINPARVRELARRYALDIPGDRVVARAKPIDVNRVVGEAIATLEGVASAVALVGDGDVAGVAPEVAADWASAMWKALVPIMGLRKDLMSRGN